MTRFDGQAWIDGGRQVDAAADSLYRAAHPVVTRVPGEAPTASPIDTTLAGHHQYILRHWHHMLASANEGAVSAASRMIATGEDYNATEESAAASRFWGEYNDGSRPR